MKYIGLFICVFLLSACGGGRSNNGAGSDSSDPATAAANKVAQKPITLQVTFSTPDPDGSWTKPAGSQPNGGAGDSVEKDIGSVGVALKNTGYGKVWYELSGNGTRYNGRLAMTPKVKAVGWSCGPSLAVGVGTDCAVPIGTMTVASASFGYMDGKKVVNFTCTPQPTAIGKMLNDDEFDYTNWRHNGARVQMGKTGSCYAYVGPDEQPEP